MARESIIPAQIVNEDIRSIEEYVGSGRNGLIRVMVGLVNSTGAFIVPQQFEMFEIKEENYEELMSESPSWAPGKPAGTYRNDDLWVFIDRIRTSNTITTKE